MEGSSKYRQECEAGKATLYVGSGEVDDVCSWLNRVTKCV